MWNRIKKKILKGQGPSLYCKLYKTSHTSDIVLLKNMKHSLISYIWLKLMYLEKSIVPIA